MNFILSVPVLLALAIGVPQDQNRDRPLKKLFKSATDSGRALVPGKNDPRNGVPRLTINSYVIETSDRWKLVAHRYQQGKTSGAPVILCHGFGYSSKFFDMRDDVSLARYLASAGFDVWAVDLRGCGLSNKWALATDRAPDVILDRLASQLSKEKIPKGGFTNIDPKYYKWDMDDHIDYDIPAILKFVKKESNSKTVSWLGHSMGGNVMLGYLAKNGQDSSVERLVTVGAQVTMPEGQLFLQYLIELIRAKELEISGRKIDVQALVARADNLFFNESNTDPALMRYLSGPGHDTPSVGLLKQYSQLSQNRKLVSSDRKTDYCNNIRNIRCPYLIVGGSVDQIAPPSVQRYLYDNVGSQDRTLLILGRRAGLRTEYGHNDSLIGMQSYQEVYPSLARWLAGRELKN